MRGGRANARFGSLTLTDLGGAWAEPFGLATLHEAKPVEGRPGRLRVDSGSVWEPIAGYSRAVRVGARILVSGTTATYGGGETVCPGDVAGQTTFILDKIAASLAALGGRLEDVRAMDTIIASADIVAADSCACTLFGKTPKEVRYVQFGQDAGLGIADMQRMRIRKVNV